jgi:hypothetical protein
MNFSHRFTSGGWAVDAARETKKMEEIEMIRTKFE